MAEQSQSDLLSEQRTTLANERTRLASERTFLSWIRTGLTFVGSGFALARFVWFEAPAHQTIIKIIGSILILAGIGIFVVSVFDFYASTRSLKDFEPGIVSRATILITGILVTISVFLLVLTLIGT